MRPVRISGPFWKEKSQYTRIYVVEIMTYGVQRDSQRPSRWVHWNALESARDARRGIDRIQTLYGLPGVIDDALVVLVRTMRKVHAD